jgi:carbon monoxide dehydrogenase subunit G
LPERSRFDTFHDIDHIKGATPAGNRAEKEAVMKIVKEFEAQGSRESVFDLFQDIPAVAQCLPGAQITGGEGEGPFQGTVTVAVGPVSASFEGEAAIASDRESFSGEIHGRGADKRGGNRGDLTLQYRLEPLDTDTTKVCIDVDVDLSGPIARFGRTGIMDEIANQLIGDFSSCLDAKLSAESPDEAASVAAGEIKGIRLFISGLSRSFRSWLGRVTRRSG